MQTFGVVAADVGLRSTAPCRQTAFPRVEKLTGWKPPSPYCGPVAQQRKRWVHMTRRPCPRVVMAHMPAGASIWVSSWGGGVGRPPHFLPFLPPWGAVSAAPVRISFLRCAALPLPFLLTDAVLGVPPAARYVPKKALVFWSKNSDLACGRMLSFWCRRAIYNLLSSFLSMKS